MSSGRDRSSVNISAACKSLHRRFMTPTPVEHFSNVSRDMGVVEMLLTIMCFTVLDGSSNEDINVATIGFAPKDQVESGKRERKQTAA